MAEIDLDKLGEQISSATDSIGKMVDVVRTSLRPAISSGSRWNQKIQKQPLYKKTSGEKTGSVFQMVFGFGGAAMMLPFVLGTLIPMLFRGISFGGIFGLIMEFLLFAGGITLGFLGIRKKQRVQRFREYVEALQGKDFIEIARLAARTGKNTKFVKNDLQDMIDERWFLQGHLGTAGDSDVLITSDETYKNYMESLETQRRAIAEEEANDELLAALSESERAIVREGEKYLTKIKEANDLLPGEVITAKLSRLENVIRRILDEVKKRPGTANDLRKLMNYYLPTTWKLLESYQEIEKEPFKTPQMITTQQQIEKTIDTVNDAFEKLLDELFRDTAWDINSDISVLNTMLVQEGLKDAEMSIKK